MLKFEVGDGTGTTIFVIFYHEFEPLANKPCFEMIAATNQVRQFN